MEQTEIPEGFKNMSTEKIIKTIYEKAVKREEVENKTIKLAVEALMKEIENNNQLTKKLEIADEKYDRLLEEKRNEYIWLMEVIEQTNDKVFDIAMETAKRIEAFENVKSFKSRTGEENEKENAAIDFAINEYQSLLQFIQYRSIPIPLSRK